MTDRLPRHPVPEDVVSRAGGILVTGLAGRRCRLSPAELGALPRRRVRADFSCEEGWSVPGLGWEGVGLADVLALARPLPNATHVRVASGEYVVPLGLEQAAAALLCDRLDGAFLAREHGGPWRLLVPGGRCFTSVKWVDRLELTDGPGEATGERIAAARLRPRAGGAERRVTDPAR